VSAAFLAGGIVYCFALTNVFMFSPQLKCMFFTIIIVGSRLPALAAKKAAVVENEEASEEFAEHDTVIDARPA
jgi:Na+/pantothenate symporter